MKADSEATETRTGWKVALGLGVAAAVGTMAVAFGVQTPAEHAARQDARLEAHDVKLADHEARIQHLEDTTETIDAIAHKLGVEVPKERHGR